MHIVYLGSGEFGIDCLNVLKDCEHSLEVIVTGPARRAGRGRGKRATAVCCWATANKMPFIETENVNSPEIIKKISSYEPDLIVVIAFAQKIGNELINLPSKGAINVHSSLLPKYRGAAPINWVIVNGERETGISIITLAEKMDAGNIAGQVKTEIQPDETAGQLHDRLARMAGGLLLETINKIADGTVVYTPQDDSKATLAPKIKKSEGFLDFRDSAGSIRNKILGFWPWPGASVLYESKQSGKRERVVIAMAKVVKSSSSLPVGTLDEDLNIVCGEDVLAVVKIKPAGGTLMDFKDFVNGRRVCPGDIFIKIEE